MDERAFSRVAEAYAGRLYAVAYRLLRNRADAEDAVQRALMKAFAARASYSPRWAVSTWLYRVLSNVCIDELRRRRPVPEPPPGHGARVTDGVERVDLARALGAVPREARLLLALHYVDGRSSRFSGGSTLARRNSSRSPTDSASRRPTAASRASGRGEVWARRRGARAATPSRRTRSSGSTSRAAGRSSRCRWTSTWCPSSRPRCSPKRRASRSGKSSRTRHLPSALVTRAPRAPSAAPSAGTRCP